MGLLERGKLITLVNGVMRQQGQLRKGTDLKYFCPTCKHYKRKLEVSIVTGEYHCWVCNFRGHTLKSLFYKLGASATQKSQLIDLVKDIHPNSSVVKNSFSEEKLSLPIEFKSLTEVSKSLEYRRAICYLKNRGITASDIIKYDLGYCESGEYSGRIIIPSYDADGNLNWFTGRSFYKDSTFPYKNPVTSKDIIGFELFLNYDEPLVLCEGPFDAIAIKRNAVPLFGKLISDKLKMKIAQNKVKEVRLILDNDALKEIVDTAEELMSNGTRLKVAVLKEKDPSLMGFEKITEFIRGMKDLEFSDLMKLKMSI